MEHCIRKIIDIIARGSDDRRSILQLGYNLGRLSELTGLGREPFWDRWKDSVESWDLPRLEELARQLRVSTTPNLPIAPNSSKIPPNPS